MSDLRQIPLWANDPQTPAEITRHTPFKATWRLFEEHLRKASKSENTITAFMGDLTLVAEHLNDNQPIGEFTTSDLNSFLNWLENGRGVPCSKKSYARRVTTLKVYFKWLHGLAAIPDDPAKPVLQRSGPAPLSFVLNQHQIQEAIRAAKTMYRKDEQDYRPELLFRLLLNTGIKKSEASRITRESFDRSNPQQPTLLVRQKIRNVFKERRIVLESDFLPLLDRYLVQYHPEDVIFNCTPRNLEYILTAVGEEGDIPFKLSFEVLRWTCAVQDYRMGMDERDLREKMGLSEVSWYETSSKIKQLAAQITEEESR